MLSISLIVKKGRLNSLRKTVIVHKTMLNYALNSIYCGDLSLTKKKIFRYFSNSLLNNHVIVYMYSIEKKTNMSHYAMLNF